MFSILLGLAFDAFVGAFIGGAIGAAIEYIILCWTDIVEWFSNFTSSNYVDTDNLGFLLKDKMENGKYNLVEGVFNTETNEVVDARRIIAADIDDETKQKIRKLRKKEPMYIELYN